MRLKNYSNKMDHYINIINKQLNAELTYNIIEQSSIRYNCPYIIKQWKINMYIKKYKKAKKINYK